MFIKTKAVSKQNIYSRAAVDTPMPPLTGKELVVFSGKHDGRPAQFGLTEDHLNKHVLLVGSTGCGKTTTFLQLVNQLQKRMTADDVMIIFDSKGDYAKSVVTKGQRLYLANSKPYRQQSEKWNIFREILMDGKDDKQIVANAQEIGRILFQERERRTNNPFFPNAARDLLAAIIIFLIRTGYQNDVAFRQQHFNNEALEKLLSSKTGDDFVNMLSFDSDLVAVASYISGGGEQAQGVLSEMHSIVREVLTGVFAEDGSFSVRDFVRNKGGKTLFIEYDLSMGSSLAPVYRLLIDLALKEALGRSSPQGNVYLICDEFKLLPYLQHIDDGVNFGRSLGVKVIAGLQSIEQLFEVYQQSRGRNIAAGFSTIIAYHSTDPSTIEYLAKAYGHYETMEEYRKPDGQTEPYRRRESVISDWDLSHLDVGEAFVCRAFGEPFSFKFDK
ncbi:MAG: type IV secretion system DNA-binding domain-containing protein [Clostridia bacterium]|nr:type IV secretion system DNA-binding domain-containing protein [Clostridia bacterium]